MKILFTFLLIAFMFMGAVAQNTIYLKNGQLIKARVEFIQKSRVYYRTSAVVYPLRNYVPLSKVSKIVYWDGREEDLPRVSVNLMPGEPMEIGKNTHSIGINLMDMALNKDLTIQYDWVNKKNRLGLRVPMIIGPFHKFLYNDQFLFRPMNFVVASGLELSLYSKKRKVSQFVFGPSAIAGNAYNYRGACQIYGRFALLGGMIFEPLKNFKVGFDLGVGLLTNFQANNNSFDGSTVPNVILNLILHINSNINNESNES